MLLCHYHAFLIVTSYAHYAHFTLCKHDNHAYLILRKHSDIIHILSPFTPHRMHLTMHLLHLHNTYHVPFHIHAIHIIYWSYPYHTHHMPSHVMSCTMNIHTLSIILLYVYLRPQHTNVSSVSSICLRPQHTNISCFVYFCAPNTPMYQINRIWLRPQHTTIK